MIHLFPFLRIFLFVLQASRLTAAARKFKQTCLQVRVFGYPSASQLDLDSFVLFSHSTEMKVGVLGNFGSWANFFCYNKHGKKLVTMPCHVRKQRCVRNERYKKCDLKVHPANGVTLSSGHG